MRDYDIGDPVYLLNTVIYSKLNYKNNVSYKITEAFKNGTVWVHRGTANGLTNIRRLEPQFDSYDTVP